MKINSRVNNEFQIAIYNMNEKLSTYRQRFKIDQFSETVNQQFDVVSVQRKFL